MHEFGDLGKVCDSKDRADLGFRRNYTILIVNRVTCPPFCLKLLSQ